MAKRENKYPQLKDASLGDSVDLFITKDHAISCSTGCKQTIAATVLGKFNGGGFTNVLVGWKTGENRARLAACGRYVRSIEDELRIYGNCVRVDDIGSYNCGVWVAGYWPYISNGINEPSATLSTVAGPFRYIKARDIQDGDVIAWSAANMVYYCICDEIEEGEASNGEPVVIVRGVAYNPHSCIRKSAGMQMQHNTELLLINRGS